MLIKLKPHGRLYRTLPGLAILASCGFFLAGCAAPKPLPDKVTTTAPARETKPPVEEVPAPPPSPAAKMPTEAEKDDREELLKYQEGVRIFREEGRAEEALGLLDGFLMIHPESAYADDALLEQARIHVSVGEDREAIGLINRLLRDFPNTPLRKRAFIEAGNIYSRTDRWRDCIQTVDNVLTFELTPEERSGALTLRSECSIQRKRYPEAVQDALESLKISTSADSSQAARSALQQAADGLKDRDLDRILAQSDGSEGYGVLAGERLERLVEKERFEEALRELMDALVHYPGLLPEEQVGKIFAAASDRLLVRSDTIGAILPLSGPYRVYGEKALQGIQAALGLFHPLPSENLTRYKLVVGDSGADPVMAQRAARKLVDNDQVLVIVGPLFSRTSRAAAQAVEGRGVPIISLSPDPAIPGLGENVFRRALTDRQQIDLLVEMAHGRLKMRKFAFLYPDTPYGHEMTQLFWDELDRRGAEVTAAESFQPGVTDFGPQIRAMAGLDRGLTPEQQTLKDSGVEVEVEAVVDFDGLFIPADFQTVGLLAPQLAFYDVTTPTLLGTDGWNSPWVTELGEHYVEGALFTGNFIPDQMDNAARELMERYWLTFGEDPQPLAAQAYDATLLIRTGLESGMVRDRKSLTRYLLSVRDFPAAEGRLTTGEDGDIAQRPHLLTVRSGNIIRFVQEID